MPLPIRETVAQMPGYVPGAQPRGPVVKLNTNENPHPPAPSVLEAIHAAVADTSRKYPDPLATDLRGAIAEFDGVDPGQVICGNGSDEILRLLMTATLDSGTEMATLWPTYSYYEFLGAQFGARMTRLEVGEDWQWPESLWTATARVLFIANPNPPVGTLASHADIARLCEAHPDSAIVCDEAYIGTAPTGATAVPLLADHPNLIVTRTLSKSHQLAGLRVGYAIGTGELIAALFKIKDSYNVNAVSQAAGAASIRNRAHFQRTRDLIVAERDRLHSALTSRGFEVPPGNGNFLFALHPEAPAIHRALSERAIHVRWFDTPRTRLGLRITVGLPEQTDALLAALDEILRD